MSLAVTPGKLIQGRVTQVMVADDGTSFRTRTVDTLMVGFEGIPGDRHVGYQKPADARVPWYKRGTPMANERHVSAVSVEDLGAIAEAMTLADVKPEWLGANIVIEGVPHFSFLPRGARLHFPSGLSLVVSDQNAPCRGPGRNIAAAYPDDTRGLDLLFPKVAKRLRGLTLRVEREGTLGAGETVEVRLPEQWIYPA